MDFKDNVNCIIEKQVEGIVKGNLKALLNELPDSLYRSAYESILDIVFDMVYKVISDEYHHFKEQELTLADTTEGRFRQFNAVVREDGYISKLYTKYPLLEKKIKIKLTDFIQYQHEIYSNYTSDIDVIRDVFNKDLGSLNEISCSLGDNHNGKSVAMLTFENGSLVYKPRSLNNAILFEKLLTFISKDASSKIDYWMPKMISRVDYGWQEYVEYLPCKNTQEACHYYERAGAYLSLFYFFNTFDMHHENVICNGQYPVLIDLETLSNARVNRIHQTTKNRDLYNSVLNTSFIPFVNPDGVFDINISGILSRPDISKKMSMSVLVESEEHDLAYEEVNMGFSVTKNLLRIADGSELSLDSIRDHLITGFERTCQYIIKNEQGFLNEIEDYSHSNEMIFRQLLRPTQVYHQFVESSVHPSILSSETKSNHLFNILLNNFTPGKHGFIRVQSEINDMTKGYIPHFYTKFKSKNLYNCHSVVCENYYTESIYETLKNKLNSFTLDSMKYQTRLIEMSILTLLKDQDFIEHKKIHDPTSEKKQLVNLDKIVSNYVSKYKKIPCETSNDTSIIYDVHLSSNKEMFNITPLSYDMYQGGGIVWLLACYGKIKNDLEITALSKKLLNGLIKNHYNSQKNINDFSVFTGFGGILYLTYNMYRLYEKDTFLDDFRDLFEQFYTAYMSSEPTSSDYDYLSGIASSIYFLSSLNMTMFDEEFQTKIQDLVNKFISKVDMYNCYEIGLAHGLSGLAMTLASTTKLSGVEKVTEKIYDLLRHENQLINQEESLPNTWCRGKTGILLARHKIEKCLLPDNTINKDIIEINSLIENVIDKQNLLDVDNLCLCHGVYGNIDILQTICDEKSDDINELLESICNFNEIDEIKWFDKYAHSLDGFMLGNSGIAYTLLKTKYNLPSVLSLEVYGDLS